MSVSPVFFRSAEVSRLLERAASVAAVPMSLHYDDTLRVMSWGACAACVYINSGETGRNACLRSRSSSARVAISQDVPVTFVCHLGFTCVTAALLAGEGYTVTLGPYIPSESAEAIEDDVSRGLKELAEDLDVLPDALPFGLADVRLLPSGALSAAAEWLVEGVRAAFVAYEGDEDDVAVPQPHVAVTLSTKKVEGTSPAVWHSMLALALLCGLQTEIRLALLESVDESRHTEEGVRVRLMNDVSAILAACRRLGGDVDAAWNAYSHFVEQVRFIGEPDGQVKAAMSVVRRALPARTGVVPSMPPYLPFVVREIWRCVGRDPELADLARDAGVAPSSVTRALEHRTGATFTELTGRVRMAHARRLLRHTRLTVAQVARSAGIHDSSNFAKLFRRVSGCSPGAYRARHGVNRET